MALFIGSTDVTVPGIAFAFSGTPDAFILLEGVTYTSTGGTGVSSSFVNSSVVINGTVIGNSVGIAMASASDVTIGARGTVLSGGEGVSMAGGVLVNEGMIRSWALPGVSSAGVLHSGASGSLTVTNTGLVAGVTGVRSLQGGVSLHNTGEIIATAGPAIVTSSLAASNDIVGNEGLIRGGVSTGDGIDQVSNAGTILGDVNLGAGIDTYTGVGAGIVQFGAINGEAGNDTLTGSDAVDGLLGGNDNDTLRGNGGIDTLDGGANDDTVFFSIEDAVVQGGSGADTARNTYDAFGLTFDMGLNGFETYFGSQAGETILTTTATAMTVNAGGGGDLVLGSSAGDTMNGDGGDDRLSGGGGIDIMNGGDGADILRGDLGNDLLAGSLGDDRFAFDGFDSTVDTIADFTIGFDKIQILRSGFLSPAQWSAGALDSARFVASANPSPILGTACFLFDNAGSGVGTLYWNDGTGSANGIAVVQFAPGQNPLFFTAQDFVLI